MNPLKQHIVNTYEYIEKHLDSSFDQIYMTYSPNMFCMANRKSIIAFYLIVEAFIADVKKYNNIHPDDVIGYYWGLDEFIKVYHDAVYNCLQYVPYK